MSGPDAEAPQAKPTVRPAMTTVRPSVRRCDGTSRSTSAIPVMRLGATARPATNSATPRTAGELMKGNGSATRAATATNRRNWAGRGARRWSEPTTRPAAPEPSAYRASSSPVQPRTSFSAENATVTTSKEPNIAPRKKKTAVTNGTPA